MTKACRNSDPEELTNSLPNFMCSYSEGNRYDFKSIVKARVEYILLFSCCFR